MPPPSSPRKRLRRRRHPLPTPTGTVAAKTFPNISVNITPLLTPDTLPAGTEGQYVSNMIKLIASAKKTLYVQLQYIEASAASGVYPALLQAIAARVAAGVDVRLIESLEYWRALGGKDERCRRGSDREYCLAAECA